jgi:predicted nucleotidyltransferase
LFGLTVLATRLFLHFDRKIAKCASFLPQGKNMPVRVFPDPSALAALCRRYRIRRLSLFGSALKGTSRADSDVDLLVEFEPDAKPSLLTMLSIEIELSPLLRGRKVDVRTAQDLSRYFRDETVQTAEVQYEAG